MKKISSSIISILLLSGILLRLTSCKSDEPPTFKIGQSYGGGIIFYLDNTKKHGLIASDVDQNITEWSQTLVVTNAIGIGTGQLNTTAIVAAQGASGNYAAIVCDKLVLNGYSDWYLPSRDELNLLYNQKAIVGGFATVHYWSSTETASNTAWGQLFTNGDQSESFSKSGNNLSIRAIRSF